MIDRIKVALLGEKFMLLAQDTMEVMSRRPQPTPEEDEKIYDEVDFGLNVGCIGGGIISVIINMITRDKLFGRFKPLHPVPLIGQFIIIMATLQLSLQITLRSIHPSILKLKSPYILSHDPSFMEYMTKLQLRYGITLQDMVQGIIKKEDIPAWQQIREKKRIQQLVKNAIAQN